MNNIKTIDDYKALSSVKATHRLAYGEHQEQFGDLYLPEKNLESQLSHPTIILLHGGCWQAAIDLSGLGQLCESLRQLGYAVWNVEYRRLGNGGGWPNTFIDTALGVDFLRQITDTYSLDLSRVTGMGHSAGGHLAMWLAARKKLSENHCLYNENPLNVDRIISLAGIPDLETAANEEICRGHIEELMGGMPNKTTENYQQVSLNYFEPLDSPVTHLIGEHDQVVPVEYLKNYSQKHANTCNKLILIPDIGHFEMVMPDTAAWDYIKKELQQNI